MTPLADINFGVGERIQLKLKSRAVISDTPGRGTRSGAGNTQLGIKWRFFQDGLHGRALSFYPQIDLNPPGHSAARGLVEDGKEIFLPVEIAQGIGATRLYAEIGFSWREHREDAWVVGLATEHSLTTRFRIAGELRQLALGGSGEQELTSRLGAKWAWSERWTLLASVGRTLREFGDERPATTAYLGLQQVF